MPCRYLHLQNKPRTHKLIYAVSFRFAIQKQTAVACFKTQLEAGKAIPLSRLHSNTNEINKDVDRHVLSHSENVKFTSNSHVNNNQAIKYNPITCKAFTHKTCFGKACQPQGVYTSN
jgi:hypothetical protein